MTPRPIGAATARRFFARRHLLAPPRSLPSGPAGVMAAVDRLGSLQFDPLEVAGRNHDLVLHARVADYTPGRGRRRPVRQAPALRDVQQGPVARPDGRAAVLPGDLGPPSHVATATSTFDEHAAARGGAARADPRATGRCPRPTSSRARRSSGTGGRRTRSGRSSRRSRRPASSASPGGRATAGSTTSWSASSRPSSSPGSRREEEQIRHKLLSRYRAHGLLGRTGRPSSGIGTSPRHPTSEPRGAG